MANNTRAVAATTTTPSFDSSSIGENSISYHVSILTTFALHIQDCYLLIGTIASITTCVLDILFACCCSDEVQSLRMVPTSKLLRTKAQPCLPKG